MAKQVLALVPSERDKECTHRHVAYLGRIPCTGPLVCHMCGLRGPDLEADRERIAREAAK